MKEGNAFRYAKVLMDGCSVNDRRSGGRSNSTRHASPGCPADFAETLSGLLPPGRVARMPLLTSE
jgi:hypothetical protein